MLSAGDGGLSSSGQHEEPGVPAKYHFLSEFTLRGDPDRIWAALIDVAQWPTWWSWLKRIQLLREATAADGVGSVYRNTIRAPAGYGLVYDTELTAVDRQRRIDVDSRGDLLGRGRFFFTAKPDGTVDVAFAWLVSTPKRWMSFLAPIARPAFSWNHDQLMSAFGRGLAGVTGAELVSMKNSTIAPGDPAFQVMPEPAA
jgi:uncharacterized protein YndB with AHSA1/START domain